MIQLILRQTQQSKLSDSRLNVNKEDSAAEDKLSPTLKNRQPTPLMEGNEGGREAGVNDINTYSTHVWNS